jgi:hypothetical protein
MAMSIDVAGDELVTGMVACVENGVNVEAYLAARGAGATHGEAYAVVQGGHITVAFYCAGLNSGASHDEMMDLGDRWNGSRLIGYPLCRQVGATHGEVLGALVSDVDLRLYSVGRNAGMGHEDILHFAESDILMPLEVYLQCKAVGATDDELTEASELTMMCMGSRPYGVARIVGRAHSDIMTELEATVCGLYSWLKHGRLAWERRITAGRVKVVLDTVRLFCSCGHCVARLV